MSTKTTIKRIALVAVSALGMGLLSVVPASAAAVSAVSIADFTNVTDAVSGTASTTAFTITTTGAASGDAIAYSLTISKPSNSSVAIAAPTANGTHAAAGTYGFEKTTPAVVAGWAVSDPADNTLLDSSTGTTAMVSKARGSISINPDVVGTYVITLSVTATPTGGAALTAVTKTWSVTVPAVNDSSFSTTSLNLTKYTTTPTVGSAVAVNLGGVFATNNAIDITDSTDFTAAVTSYPAGGYVGVTAAATTAAGAAVSAMDDMTAIGASASGAILTRVSADNNFTAVTVTSSSTVGIGSYSFTPTKAGVYTLTVWNDNDQDGIIDVTETRQTIDITVVAAAGYSAPLSTVYSGTGATAATAATDLLPISASKTTGTQAANIRVAIKNTSGAAYTGQTVTASIAGPGLLGAAQTNAAADTADTTAGTVRATSVTDTNGYVSVTVWPDGTSGTGVVTISVTDQVSGATTVLGTESVVFYGSVAKLSVDVANYTVLKAGG